MGKYFDVNLSQNKVDAVIWISATWTLEGSAIKMLKNKVEHHPLLRECKLKV